MARPVEFSVPAGASVTSAPSRGPAADQAIPDALRFAPPDASARSPAILQAEPRGHHEHLRRALRGFRLITGWLVAADVACVIAALSIVHIVRDRPATPRLGFVAILVVAPVLWILVFRTFGLLSVQHLPASEEFRRLISAVSVGTVLIMVVGAWSSESLSRAWLMWTWLFALALELVARRIVHWYIRRGRRLGALSYRTLIVGTNQEAVRLAHTLAPPVRGFVPLGYIARSPSEEPLDGLPVLGSLDEIADAIRTYSVECIFVASTAVSDAELLRVSGACRRARVEMRVSANLPQIFSSHLAIQQIDEIMAVAVRPARLDGGQAVAKRAFDLIAGTFILLASLPLMVTIAIAIGLTSRGPILFRQDRMTKDGRTFRMLKFRTMIADADRALDHGVIDITTPFFKLRDDPRSTKVGRLLRMYSLDELPQLWNVLRGDMSLVGPRPLRIEQIATDPEHLTPRHEVKAGLTGWWQINGRNDVPYEQALRMDLVYIENWSLSLDIYILLKTIGVLLARRGAY